MTLEVGCKGCNKDDLRGNFGMGVYASVMASWLNYGYGTASLANPYGVDGAG